MTTTAMPSTKSAAPSAMIRRMASAASIASIHGTHDQAKAQMAGRRVDRLGHTRGWAIAPAIIGRAEIRTALHHLARDAHAGHARIVAFVAQASARVLRAGTAGGCRPVARLIPIRRPFPDIADHVVQPVSVRRERPNRRGALVTVAAEVLPRKFALPGV